MNAPLALSISLPAADRRMQAYTLSAPRDFPTTKQGTFNRVAYSAAHVVADPLAAGDPWVDCAVDWDATIAFRQSVWKLGLGVAEAMDTAQRGMGMDWPTSLELIRRSIDAAKDIPGAFLASGAGTDQLAVTPGVTVDQVIAAYEEQFEAIEKLGGRIILMASRALVVAAQIARRLSARLRPPAAPGEGAGDHPLAGRDVRSRARRLLGPRRPLQGDGRRRRRDPRQRGEGRRREGLAARQAEGDRHARAEAPPARGVRMYTGDDFNYAELIEGDAQGYSDALLGIFDAIAPAASAALTALAAGDRAKFHEILAPTVPLSRHIFRAPTRFYKTGVVFLAWLNGHQDHFVMVGGQQSTRNVLHLADIFRLADKAGLLRDPELACSRMRALMATQGLRLDAAGRRHHDFRHHEDPGHPRRPHRQGALARDVRAALRGERRMTPR